MPTMAETSFVREQDKRAVRHAGFPEANSWYIGCFYSGVKMRRTTTKEVAPHFFPDTRRSVDKSPLNIRKWYRAQA
jgi:hypothetical protein